MIPLAALLLAASLGAEAAPKRRDLAFRKVGIDLPAQPIALVPADLDGDGRQDLVAVVEYTVWGGESFDRIEGMVQITEVVPAIFARREARAFLAQPEGGYREVGPPLALPPSVISIRTGTVALPVLVLSDTGASALRLGPLEGRGLTLEPLLTASSLLAGSIALLPDLEILRDADGDGRPDLLLPTTDGLAIFRGLDAAFETEAAFRGSLPGDRVEPGVRSFPWPEIADVNRDGKPDLLLTCSGCPLPTFHVLPGRGGCRFGDPVRIGTGCLGLGTEPETKRKTRERAEEEDKIQLEKRRVIFFGDLDGDGLGDLVTRHGVDTGKSDLKQMKKPRSVYRFYRLSPDLTVQSTPWQTLEIEGYASSGNLMDETDPDFKDLDGDGRQDLIALTVDFSMWQAVRVLATKKIGVDLDFSVWCAGENGQLARTPDPPLREKLRFDLNNIEISRLAQFRGDFDGDGRIDFLRLGKGKSIEIHRGNEGCRYAAKPDLSVTLDADLENVLLLNVADLDGDGVSDLAIARPLPSPDERVSAPARMEILLSGALP